MNKLTLTFITANGISTFVSKETYLWNSLFAGNYFTFTKEMRPDQFCVFSLNNAEKYNMDILYNKFSENDVLKFVVDSKVYYSDGMVEIKLKEIIL